MPEPTTNPYRPDRAVIGGMARHRACYDAAVAEIVEALRHDIEFHREGAEQRSLPAVADWIEDRFGGEKGEGDA